MFVLKGDRKMRSYKKRETFPKRKAILKATSPPPKIKPLRRPLWKRALDRMMWWKE